jgi:hypothetical protein
MPAFFTPFSGAEVFKEKERGNVAAVIRGCLVWGVKV